MGPISYSILHICVIAFILPGDLPLYGFHARREAFFPQGLLPSWEPNKKPSRKGLNEEAKADLILKHKTTMDEGILTQEEFERKKEELLK